LTTDLTIPNDECAFRFSDRNIDAAIIHGYTNSTFQGTCRYEFQPKTFKFVDRWDKLFLITIKDVNFLECGVSLFIYYRSVSITDMVYTKPDLDYDCRNPPPSNPYTRSTDADAITIILFSQLKSSRFSFEIDIIPFLDKDDYTQDIFYCDNVYFAKSLQCDGYANCGDMTDELNCTTYEIIKGTSSVIFMVILVMIIVCCIKHRRRHFGNKRNPQHTIVTEAGVPIYTPPNSHPMVSAIVHGQSSATQNPSTNPLQNQNLQYGYPNSTSINYHNQPGHYMYPPDGFHNTFAPNAIFSPENMPPNFSTSMNDEPPPPYAPPSYEETIGNTGHDMNNKTS